MVLVKSSFFIILLACCESQLFDLIPNVFSGASGIVNQIATQPLVQSLGRATADTAATAFNTFVDGPLNVAGLFGITDITPIISDSNNVDLIQSFLADFKIGQGNEDVYLPISQLVTKYGRPFEEHKIITSDGYVLKVHRIPKTGPVVFLMHGVLSSSDDFVVSGPESGLAYILSDSGYDVWMGNARGNKHSREHIHMHPSQADFWDFSWHEIGCFDLPAMIDYVLRNTNEEKLKYIGHSQGTTVFFVMASERPEYNDKISLMVALSPVAFMTHVKSPIIRMMAVGEPVVHGITKAFGIYEFFPSNSVLSVLSRLICGIGPVAEILCGSATFLVTGFGLDQLNVTNLPVVQAHSPAGSSTKQFAHYGQGVLLKDFKQFDYGPTENLKRYGAYTSPKYDLSKISTPVSLVYSDADWLAVPEDVEELYNNLPNCVDIHMVPHHQFNHLDFIFGKDVNELICRRMQKVLTLF